MEIIIKSHKYGEKKVLIDDEDLEKIKEHIWHLQYAKTIKGFYVNRHSKSIKGKRSCISLHRYIVDAQRGEVVDHINHNTLDNRKENLRKCTHSQNSGNRNKMTQKCSSHYKGVTYNLKTNKYIATIQPNNTSVHLGYFETEDQAAIAYNIAAVKYFGEFARPNDNIMMHKGFH